MLYDAMRIDKANARAYLATVQCRADSESREDSPE